MYIAIRFKSSNTFENEDYLQATNFPEQSEEQDSEKFHQGVKACKQTTDWSYTPVVAKEGA